MRHPWLEIGVVTAIVTPGCGLDRALVTPTSIVPAEDGPSPSDASSGDPAGTDAGAGDVGGEPDREPGETDGGDPRAGDVSEPYYVWTTGPWGACSETCGQGTHSRTVQCIEQPAGTTVSEASCAPAAKPPTSEPCTETSGCTYAWQVGTWGNCSPACNGTQTRSVWCERTDGATVSDTLCAGTKPASNQSCSTCCPSCGGNNCGGDGCGGSCGTCAAGSCHEGRCAVFWTEPHDGTGPYTCEDVCFIGWGTSCCGGSCGAPCIDEGGCLGDCSTSGVAMTCEFFTYTTG